ncbi:MAG TPA: hypothetical protein VMF58_07350 [Rhizomicrobium sp.]|nr:hypothetical protein [Rhizomicrobium sp.]
MKLKTSILGGAAVAGLVSALSLTPAMAFTHHPGTPAEHAQTEDLNQQQLQQAQSGTTTTASATTTPTTDQTAQAAPAAPEQAAQAAPSAPDQTAQAAAPAAPVQTASTMPLDSISNPPQTLANASVETSNGQAVGAVQRVITDAAGKAKTVVVALLGKASRLVAIAANQLTFDQSRNVVVAQLSADQIDNLPMAPQS